MPTFDQSLPTFASIVRELWGDGALLENFFLRDVSGRLTFIVLDAVHDLQARRTLARRAREVLDEYVDGDDLAVATPDELFDARLSEKEGLRRVCLVAEEFSGEVGIIDRRMVGGDWLRPPVPLETSPVRLAFASIKGGVGRSTALCVLASHLAAKGLRVLTVDMDLEAPGLGNMLLPGGTLPRLGLLDYLVESSLRTVDEQFVEDMVASSWIGGGVGRVDVIPALGELSLANPANVLAKISRAYLASGEFHAPQTFTDRVSGLLARMSTGNRYDVILIDARAGLHETTASSFVGLGAHIFLFGIEQPQTFTGFELLLSHLSMFSFDSGDSGFSWLDRVTFVCAKSSGDDEDESRFRSRVLSVIAKYSTDMNRSDVLSNISDELDGLKDQYEVEWREDEVIDRLSSDLSDDEAVDVVSIRNDDRFRFFDPISDRAQLDGDVYDQAYCDFIAVADALIPDLFEE